MAQPVTLENDHLRLELWPHIGGKVSSLIDKHDRHELLFAYPSEIPTGPQYDRPYQTSWYQGWDECFPAVAPGRYPHHPYDGVAIPDHGELFGLPTQSIPSSPHGLLTTWHGLRFGYTLTRDLQLEGNSLLAHYTLTNLAPFPFHFVWAQHALLALPASLQLALPAGAPFRFSHDHTGATVDKPFAWPTLDTLDFATPSALPPKHGWKLFSADPISTPVTLYYPTRHRALTMEFSSPDVRAYWGIWITTGAWASHHHIAIEPTTGRHDHLDRSTKDHSAATVAPNSKATWTTRWTVAQSTAG